MKTVRYKTVLYGVARRLGWNPDSDDGLAVEQAARIGGFLNERVREGWEFAWWPELMVCEERDVSTDGDDVRYVPFEASGKTRIGSVLRVATRNPLVSSSPEEWGFVINADGVVLSGSAPDAVWVQFRKICSEFSATAWLKDKAYVVGDVRHYEAGGECYVAIQAGTNKQPDEEAEYWAKVDFPAWLRRPVILGVTADVLMDEEHFEKSDKMEWRKDKALGVAVDVELGQQKQVMRAEVDVG